MADDPHYQNLTPDLILDAVETCGFRCDGRQHALNSYENRVYQVWLDDGGMLIAKFYRPQRWSDAAILEEHAYAQELADREIPVVAPLAINGKTLHSQTDGSSHSGHAATDDYCGGRGSHFFGEELSDWIFPAQFLFANL